jgi:hypothetical protein
MSVPDEVRRDAERTGELVGKKLMEIMELQADIDALLRDDPPRRLGRRIGSMPAWKPCSESWQ